MNELHDDNGLQEFTFDKVQSAVLREIAESSTSVIEAGMTQSVNQFWLNAGLALGFRWSTVTTVVELPDGRYSFQAVPEIGALPADAEARGWAAEHGDPGTMSVAIKAFIAGRNRGFGMGVACRLPGPRFEQLNGSDADLMGGGVIAEKAAREQVVIVVRAPSVYHEGKAYWPGKPRLPDDFYEDCITALAEMRRLAAEQADIEGMRP